jgi:hypothetical protein
MRRASPTRCRVLDEKLLVTASQFRVPEWRLSTISHGCHSMRFVTCLVPSSASVPAAAAQQDDNKNDDQNCRNVHVRLLSVLAVISTKNIDCVRRNAN